MFIRLFAVLILASFSFADDVGTTFEPKARVDKSQVLQRSAVALQSIETIVPQLIIGGEWNTTLKLVNRGTASIPATDLFFNDNLGNSANVTFQVATTNSAGQIVKGSVLTTSNASFTLSPGTAIEATFFGTSDVKFGHILIGCGPVTCSHPGLYGEVILRNKNPTRPDFESVFPLERPETLQYMVWDHRDGLTSVLYLVSPLTASTVTLEFRNAANQIIRTLTIPMRDGESQILTLHALAPETIGSMGTLVIRSGTAFVVATALRINPSNSFTPVRAFIPSTN